MAEQRQSIRQIAKNCGDRFYFTDKPCKHGHTSVRIVSDGRCTICAQNWSNEYRRTHLEACRKTIRDHYNKNKKLYIDRAIKWAIENSEKKHESKTRYAQSDVGKLVKYEGCARRRATKMNATPSWLTDDDIQEIRNIYEQAKILSEKHGIKYHVDHVIPLSGKNVSGLHVPWNLQILTKKDNMLKSNRIYDNG